MRTIVDIPEEQVKALDRLGNRNQLSRAELVRRALTMYLQTETEKTGDTLDQYYGFLKNHPEAFDGLDGLQYQEKIRAEWDERDRLYSNWGLHDRPQASYEANLPPQKK